MFGVPFLLNLPIGVGMEWLVFHFLKIIINLFLNRAFNSFILLFS